MLLSSHVSVILIGLSWIAQATPPGTGAAAQDESASDVLLPQQVPETAEDLRKRIELAESRAAELKQSIESAKDETDEGAKAVQAARQELQQVWQTYLEGLRRLVTLRENLARVSSPEHLDALADELAKFKEETSTLRRMAVPAEPTEERVTEVQARLSEVKAQVDALAESQTQLTKQVAEGFQQQEQSLTAEREQLRARREEITKQLAQPAALGLTASEQQRLRLEKERVDVRLAVVQLALHQLKPAAEYARHMLDQGERRLGAMRALLAALQDRLNALNEARARARVKELETADTRSPTEAALRNLKLFSERVLLVYFQDPEQSRRLQDRFPQRAAERLQSRVELANAYWSRANESLAYQSAEELLALFQQAREAIADNHAQLVALQSKLDKTLDELQRLQSVRERALRRFNVLADQVTATVDRNDTAQRTQIQSAITTERAALVEAMGAGVASVEEVSSRLEQAIKRLEEHEGNLTAAQDTLRWMRLTNRDSGIWGADWAGAWAEVIAIWQPQSPTSIKEGDAQLAETLHRELFGQRPSAHDEWRQLGSKLAGSLRSIRLRQWVWMLVGVVAAGLVGLVLHWVARGQGVRLARQIVEKVEAPRDEAHPAPSGLSARINLMLLNMVGDVAIPVLIVAALLFGGWWIQTDVLTMRLATALFGIIVFALVLARLVHHLFEADSPPHRPIPCSDRVARHYRKWIVVMIIFSVVVLLIPVLLRIANVSAALQAVLFELHKTGLLLLLLLFLLRKNRVLGLDDVGRLHWGLMLTWVIYPLLVMAVVVLLVLQVIGYGLLVTYVGTGLLLSFGIVFVLGTLIEYFSDVIERRAWRLQHPEAGTGTESAAVTGGMTLEAGRSLYVITLLRWFVRIAGLAFIIYLIMRAWDVPVEAAAIDWRRVGLGVLTIFVALLLDRLILTLLVTLGATGRMPESTVGIIRRWVRGVLTAVVALTIIAIAGFDVKSLWTLLATFLAMVAIGFVAVWSILSNVLATLVILIWRPFNVGEHISVLPEDLQGEVVDINFIYTTLKSEDGTKLSIPNNLFAQKFIRRKVVRGQPQRTLAEQLEADKPLGE